MTHNTDMPSGRIRFALEALKEAESSDFIEVDMDWFRVFLSTRKCLACLGGAAYLKTKGIAFDAGLYENVAALNPSISDFESSLDCLRSGDVSSAFRCMQLSSSSGYNLDREICGYHEDPVQFYADMNTLADDLEKAGY